LEIGAGTGYFSLNLLRSGVIGRATCSDISAGMLATLRENARRLALEVRTERVDAERLPFAAGSFDLVLGHAVLHHIPDLRRAFAEFARVLAPGGTLLFAGEPSPVGVAPVRLSRVPAAPGPGPAAARGTPARGPVLQPDALGAPLRGGALVRQVADALRGREHERLQFAQHLGLTGRVVVEAHRSV